LGYQNHFLKIKKKLWDIKIIRDISSNVFFLELGLHANNFTFGLQNFRLPLFQGIAPNAFPPQFSPFTPAQIQNQIQNHTIQQFLQQSNLAQNYVSQQKVSI